MEDNPRIDELAPLGMVIARGAAVLGRGVAGVAKKVGPKVKKAVTGAAKETVKAGAEGVATAMTDKEKKQQELQQQQASDDTLNAGREYSNPYVNKLMETRSPESRARTKGRKEFGTPGRKGKLTDKTPAEIVARGLGQRAAKNIAKAETRETAARDIDTHHNVPSGPEASKSLRSHARQLRKTAGEQITRGKQEVFGKRSKKRAAVADHTEYQRIGALMAEALGLVEGKTTGADARATGERVQRGAEAAEEAGKKSKADIHRQVLRIKAKVGAKHSDTGRLKPQDRSFGNQEGESLDTKRANVRKTTQQRNKARREFVQGQRSAERPEAKAKRQEGDKQTAKDLKAAVGRFPAGRKP